MPDVSHELDAMEAAATLERAGLVRLCARLTSSPDAAEDLAHETLYEALRSVHKLHDPEGRPRWLAAIARNVCMRWARSRGRELARVSIPRAGDGAEAPGVEALPDQGSDLEVELERGELVEILDRALALLPPETRDVLVRRYVHESPHAEIAERLGVTEKAVWARIGRGKLLLQRALETDLREEAVAYGLVVGDDGGWRETRIWCFLCGRYRLLGRFTDDHTELTFRCPGCSSLPWDNIAHLRSQELFADVEAFKPALKRLLQVADERFSPALVDGGAPCHACGCFVPLRPGLGHPAGECFAREPTAHLACPACGSGMNIGLLHLDLTLPQAERFWREHPRLRRPPAMEVESDGRPALVTRLESVTDRARLEIIHDRDTWRVLDIHGPTGE